MSTRFLLALAISASFAAFGCSAASSAHHSCLSEDVKCEVDVVMGHMQGFESLTASNGTVLVSTANDALVVDSATASVRRRPALIGSYGLATNGAIVVRRTDTFASVTRAGDGSELWRHDTNSDETQPVAVATSGDRAFAAFGNRVFIYDAADGTEQVIPAPRSVDPQIAAGMAVDGDDIYLTATRYSGGTSSFLLYAFRDGSWLQLALWERTTSFDRSLALTKDAVVLAVDARVYLLSKQDGSQLAEIDTPDDATNIVADGSAIYWLEGVTIHRANVDGSSVRELRGLVAENGSIGIDENALWITDEAERSVMRVAR